MIFSNVKKNGKIKYETYSYKTMSGGDKLIGVAIVKMKIMNIEKNMQLFVIDKKDLKYDDIVLGLYCIVNTS